MVSKRNNKSLSMKHAYQLLCLLFLIFAVTLPAQAQSVTLAWNAYNAAPATYRLFQRTSGQSYDYSKSIYEGSEATCKIDNLAPDTTYYFVARTYTNDNQSGDSNEVSYTTPAALQTVLITDQHSGTDAIVVIDNGDSESYSTGSWKNSSGKNPFGENSLFSRDADATYTFDPSLTGVIDVSLWWTEWSSRSTSVPVRIYDGNNLLDTVFVDQKADGGRWYILGRYSFSQSARVTVVSKGNSSSTCADAAQFSMVTDAMPISDPSPAPPTDSDKDSGTDISMVIDNVDSKSYSVGTWKNSSGKNPFGDNSVFSRYPGATYTFESSLTGALDVSLWWTEWDSRCNSVPIHIYDGDEILDTVYVNQLEDGGQWNFLGDYIFKYSAEIVIVSESYACSTCADAVRIESSK